MSTDTGQRAERAAALYLEMRGYQIIERNWRRPRVEIDIVAKKDDTMYFVEVKYRATNDQGGGLEAITASKLKKMRYGANLWVEENEWPHEYCISAIELGGRDYIVFNFVESVL